MLNSITRIFFLLVLLSATSVTARAKKSSEKPNVVIFFLDDSGWADFSPFGEEQPYKTPNVEKLANEGCRFTNFYVPQAICSASRSALLTGCYPGRTKVFGAHGPNERGVDPSFTTMGEMFQQTGYKTAIFGKWHCGDQEDTRPAARGFDRSAGLMYSNDMWEFHATNPKYWGQWPLRYWKDNEVTIERVTQTEQKQMTTWAAEESVKFIEENKENPFFLYVPFSMPHVPLFCSDKFEGKSGHGLYGDVMMELDWAIGEVLDAVKRSGNEKNTIVVFSSDNGPWAVYGEHAGRTPFREAKATAFDGGIKTACIIKYPKHIKKGGTVETTFSSVDLLPTLAELTGATVPESAKDGLAATHIVLGKEGAKNSHEYYPISTGKNLQAIISGDGKWKLHLAHPYHTIIEDGVAGQAGKSENREIVLSLFDLENDPYERHNVIHSNKEMAQKLQDIAARHKKEFGYE